MFTVSWWSHYAGVHTFFSASFCNLVWIFVMTSLHRERTKIKSDCADIHAQKNNYEKLSWQCTCRRTMFMESCHDTAHIEERLLKVVMTLHTRRNKDWGNLSWHPCTHREEKWRTQKWRTQVAMASLHTAHRRTKITSSCRDNPADRENRNLCQVLMTEEERPGQDVMTSLQTKNKKNDRLACHPCTHTEATR